MLLTFFALFALCAADPKKYTGEGVNNLWDNLANWDPPAPPTADDDLVIPDNFDILIGTAAGGVGKSLKVGNSKISVLGCSLKIAGALELDSGANVIVSAGSGIVSAGKGTISEGATLDWKSGSIGGDWVIAEKGLLSLTSGGNLLTWASGTLEVRGTLSIEGSSFFNMNGTVKNLGAINIAGPPSGDQFANIERLVESLGGSGQITVSGNVQFKELTAENVLVSSGLTKVVPLGKVSVNKFAVSSTATLASFEPSNSTFQGFSSAGVLQLNGAFAVITVVDSAKIASIVGKLGSIHFLEDSSVAKISGDGITLGVFKTVTVNDLLVNGSFHLIGSGVLELTGQAELHFEAQVAATLLVSKALTLKTKQFTLDGTLNISSQAVVTITDFVSFFGPSNVKAPGKISNDGLIAVNANTTVNTILYSGQGSFSISKSQLDLQATKVYAQTFSLLTADAVLRGESLILGYNSLVGPSNGATLAYIADTMYSSCTSPCPAKSTNFPYQVYRAWVTKS